MNQNTSKNYISANEKHFGKSLEKKDVVRLKNRFHVNELQSFSQYSMFAQNKKSTTIKKKKKYRCDGNITIIQYMA